MKPFQAIIISFAVIISFSQATAQGSYFSGAFGYGFPGGDRIGIESPGGVNKNVYGSFGKGLTLGLNTGYMVNDNAGLDLGIWYVMGSTYEFTTFDTNVGNVTDLVSGKTIRIMPAIKVCTEKEKKLYAKFGLILGIATELNDDETYYIASSGGSTPVFARQEFRGGTSFGWMGTAGIEFSGNQNISVFIEVNFFHQNYFPGMLTQYAPGLPAMTYRLVDEPNPAATDEKLKPSFPFSTAGITLGVKFLSSSKKKNGAPTPLGK
jgi:opacity protein-like surface antigen